MFKAKIIITVLIVILCTPFCKAADALYKIINTECPAGAGQSLIPVAAQFPLPAQGFSMALRHDCPGCLVTGISVENTIAFEADYVRYLADPDKNTVVIGLLMDAAPPFDGKTLPAMPGPETVLFLEITIKDDTPLGQYIFSFVREGLPSGNAWIYNTYSSENISFPVTSFQSGVFSTGDRPSTGLPLFLRGDANQDMLVDVADAVYLLQSLYQRKALPPCIDACDVNDSGMVDISDAVYLLAFLFNDGPEPPLPGLVAGIDWTPDPFNCEQPSLGFIKDPWFEE